MFKTAQWAVHSEAAQSLAQTAARGAAGDPRLAALARERQDLVAEWRQRDRQRNEALGLPADRRDAKAEAEALSRLARIDARVGEIDKLLAKEFPDYASLVSPAPLSVEEVQAQLGADEALVLFLDTPEWAPTPEETFVWAVTRTGARWVRSKLALPGVRGAGGELSFVERKPLGHDAVVAGPQPGDQFGQEHAAPSVFP
jgi:hypothetical protein